MTIQKTSLLDEARQLKDKLVSWRRDFHQHPELGFEETRTASIVADHLEQFGYEVQTNVGKTGVVGILRGKEPGPTFGLRADMDALPMQDEKDVAYRSTIPGKMHACGHDAHTAILMGVAELFARTGLESGTLKLVFQPAEEGRGGAQAMIDDGVLLDPPVDAMAGLHVHPTSEVGTVAIAEGPIGCAAADLFDLMIVGKGGHAAHPHRALDPVPVAAEIISGFQQIASRRVDPLDPVVVTVGEVHAGTAPNIIAPHVRMSGTARSLSPDLRTKIPAWMESIIKGVTEAHGATYDFQFHYKFPSIQNDKNMKQLFVQTAEKLVGEENIIINKPSMGGEDFACFSELVPSVFFRLGVGHEVKAAYSNHHPKFDIDEDALPHGVALLSQLALNYFAAKRL
ncbi:M20 metallopeptidase family protein [Bacillus fonticola]|uniref:M20 metallopeptidase family protein n=1 Tax=Bacillus fonticola TaxID=2728853 RepID=UPI001476586A|nr:M20 family metallopeptidase [Bacillus fonticola]